MLILFLSWLLLMLVSQLGRRRTPKTSPTIGRAGRTATTDPADPALTPRSAP
jgi:hypothetical protein